MITGNLKLCMMQQQGRLGKPQRVGATGWVCLPCFAEHAHPGSKFDGHPANTARAKAALDARDPQAPVPRAAS